MTRESFLERIAEDESLGDIIFHPFTMFGVALYTTLAMGGLLDYLSQISKPPQYEYRTSFRDVNNDGVEDRITERRVLPNGTFEKYDLLAGKRFAALIKWEQENAK